MMRSNAKRSTAHVPAKKTIPTRYKIGRHAAYLHQHSAAAAVSERERVLLRDREYGKARGVHDADE